MSEQKHTPGPWIMWTSNSWLRICDSIGLPVLTPINDRSDGHPNLNITLADAQLIVSAPDLFDACQLLLKEIIAERDCLYEALADPDSGEVTDSEGKQGLADLDKIINQAQAAITKATDTSL